MSSEVDEVINRAKENGRYIIAAFRFADGKLDLDRVSCDFPLEQFRAAVELFKQNLNEELGNKGLTLSNTSQLKIHPRSSNQP